MSRKYKFVDTKGIYFITSTIVGCTDVFTRKIYQDILSAITLSGGEAITGTDMQPSHGAISASVPILVQVPYTL